MNKTSATVFNIARCSLNDGPGVRTVVYLKGCPLRCAWCHNPEGLAAEPELLYHAARCIGCGRCGSVCPAHHSLCEGRIVLEREGCSRCMRCAGVCPNGALLVCGKTMTADEVVAEVRKDEHYYKASGGGVTLSGGECLLFPAFAEAVLSACRSHGIHTAVETALHVPWESIGRVLPHTDLFLADIKHPDPEKHRRRTGADNRLILENLSRLSRTHTDIRIRIPLIPGVNDDEGTMSAAAAIINELGSGVRTVEPLRYNHLAEGKYTALGLPLPFAAEPQTDEQYRRIALFLRSRIKDKIAVICEA